MEERIDGEFYWVRDGAEWHIARKSEGRDEWWVWGADWSLDSHMFDEIGPKVETPQWLQDRIAEPPARVTLPHLDFNANLRGDHGISCPNCTLDEMLKVVGVTRVKCEMCYTEFEVAVRVGDGLFT